jgi:hypothetical protein
MIERFSICKYGNRFWAVYEGGTLIYVVVYRKGALEVKRRLEQLTMSPGSQQ